MRLIRQVGIVDAVYKALVSYPAPTNLSYFWNFGVYAFVCLLIQILTGVLLAMHYVPDISLAFTSVEHIMRDVNYGWLLRYVHANGASMFFLVVYIHTFRGLYYSSYTHPRQLLWLVGVIIMLLMIVTAFLGYVLVWGQMSYWAATVITNILTAIPYVGDDVVVWIWGGFAINNATLTRFFSLHYLLPFVITLLVFVHLILLHEKGSNNPVGIVSDHDKSSFNPYYIYKDMHGLIMFFIFFSVFVMFIPNFLGHSDNYITANPLVTPKHIVPEWYFLPFYAMLRSIPDKLFGVIAMISSIFTLALIPWFLKPETRSMRHRPIARHMFWVFVMICLFLGYLGMSPIEYPYLEVGQVMTAMYFIYFFLISPLIIAFEKFSWSNSVYTEYICSLYR